MEDEEIKNEAGKQAETPNVPPAPTGRSAILEAYKAENPDLEDEPDDDALFGYAHDRHGKVSGANAKLAEIVAKDPRAGMMLNLLVGEGKSFPYAAGKVYGSEWPEGDLEEFEAGYQENLKDLAESNAKQEEANKNFTESLAGISAFVKDNGLGEEQAAQLTEAIYTDAENLLMGIIPAEYVDYKWKGMNYDKDVQEAADTAFVEGRNEAIDIKKKKAAAPPLPDLASGSGAGKSRPAPRPQKRGSFFDEFDKEQS